MKVRILQEVRGKWPVPSTDAQGKPALTNVPYHLKPGEEHVLADAHAQFLIDTYADNPHVEHVEG